jgi:hypothetical protein
MRRRDIITLLGGAAAPTIVPAASQALGARLGEDALDRLE